MDDYPILDDYGRPIGRKDAQGRGQAKKRQSGQSGDSPPGKSRRDTGIHHKFTPEDDREHPEEWIVPAQNRYHRYVKKSIQMPPEMADAMEAVIDSKQTPYANVADLMRHAISRQLQWLHRTHSESTPPGHMLVTLRGIVRITQASESKTAAMNTLARLDRQAQTFITAGDIGEAFKLLTEVTHMIKQMPVSSLQQRFSKQFWAKYGGFISSGGKIAPSAADLTFANVPDSARDSFLDEDGQGKIQ